MAGRPRNHNDYTVGWVCALPQEQTVAIAMLDERHPNLPRPSRDRNTYALGAIGGHNVAIACLPVGKSGAAHAATVALQMVITFPCIKFGLMVGTGSGIPAKVRLGDIVVSTPTGQHPGVVQWDFGNEAAGHEFQRRGSLNNPPTLLLTALSRVISEHELAGSKIQGYLDEMALKYPRLAPKYKRPDPSWDVLFRADYEHYAPIPGPGDVGSLEGDEKRKGGESDEEECCRYCDKTQAIKRRPRDLRIHYGLILSGTRVLRSATFRDEMCQAFDNEALCVDTEAAGLMNDFPCLVIRGIYDYADSHSNEAWRGHAAAVAAAFAKELLGHVHPIETEKEKEVKDILGSSVGIVSPTTKRYDISSDKRLDNEEEAEILNWLIAAGQGSQQEEHVGISQKRTGEWLCASETYKNWLGQPGKALFCPGIEEPGTRTILTLIVANDLARRFLTESSVAVARLCCDGQEGQTVESLLSDLLKQLARSHPTLPQHLIKLHERHRAKQTRPSLDEISEALELVIAQSSRVFIVIDALDEYQNYDRTRLLSHLFDLQIKTGANIFATSGNVPKITAEFRKSLSMEFGITGHPGDRIQYRRKMLD